MGKILFVEGPYGNWVGISACACAVDTVDQKRPFLIRVGPFMDHWLLTGCPYGKGPYAEASYGQGPLFGPLRGRALTGIGWEFPPLCREPKKAISSQGWVAYGALAPYGAPLRESHLGGRALRSKVPYLTRIGLYGNWAGIFACVPWSKEGPFLIKAGPFMHPWPSGVPLREGPLQGKPLTGKVPGRAYGKAA